MTVSIDDDGNLIEISPDGDALGFCERAMI